MFGYVVLNKPEIKFKDFDLYRSFYCGLCRELKRRFGIRGQLTLTYDMTFVILLLSGLYEPPTQKGTTRCAVHPVCVQQVRKNIFTEYGADMNVFLAYYKCEDDWKDEKKLLSLAFGKLLKSGESRAKNSWSGKTERILKLLDELSAMEKSGEDNLDRVSGCFGQVMAEILAWQEDEWEQSLRRMGFYLGKFIYLLDAFEDVEEDVKKRNYNLFAGEYKTEGFSERVRELLLMMMAEACREFEKLPVIRYADILRNILYSGVWCRFETVSEKRKKNQEKRDV